MGFRMGGTHVYLWPIHVDDGKNNDNIIIILQLKSINKILKMNSRCLWFSFLGLLTYTAPSFIGKSLILPACSWP